MTARDEEHLRLLTLFHYIVGVIQVLCACFPVFHLVIGISMLTGAFPTEQGEAAPPVFFGLMFTVIPAFIILASLALGIASFIVARNIQQRRGRMFCLVVAGCLCLVMPHGTVLGVLTIIVLSRDSVRVAFDEPTLSNQPPAVPPPA